MISRPTREMLVALALGLALFLPALGSYDLWNPDEPRYAEVTREMRETGEWLVPHLNGEVYAQKPPLLFWAMGLSAAVTGELDEWDARLPSALAAVGTALLLLVVGRRLFSARAGWIAAAALATNVKVLWQGRFGQIDMLLTFLVTAAMACWMIGRERDDPRWYPFFWLLAGLATLAKGPVGLLPPLIGILAYLSIRKDRDGLRRLAPGRGLLLWGLVVLAWLVPAAIRAGDAYLQEIAFRQTVTRYANPWHHYHPWYYYLTVIPTEFFPWSFLLPGALVAGWRGLEGRRREGFLLALCWAVATIVFFSLSRAKRDVYVLTMYPAMALVVGAGIDRLLDRWPAERRWLSWGLAGLAAVAVLAVGAVPVAASRLERRMDVIGSGFAVGAAVAVGVLGLAASIGWWLSRRGRPAAGVATLAGGAWTMGAIAMIGLIPRLDPIRSLRPVADALTASLAPGEAYAIYGRVEPAILFYSGRQAVVTEEPAELDAFLSRPGEQTVLIREDRVDELGPPLSGSCRVVNPDADRPYVLWVTDAPAVTAKGDPR